MRRLRRRGLMAVTTITPFRLRPDYGSVNRGHAVDFSSGRLRLATAMLLGLISSCGTAPTALSPPPPPPNPATGLRLSPEQILAVPGATIQVQALLDGAVLAAGEVAWSVSDTTLGQISSAGLLAVTTCFRGGQTIIRAVLSRDTTKQSTAEVVIVLPALAWVFISTIDRAAEHQPADLDRISGTVEVTVRAPGLACHDLVGLQLQVTGPAGDTLLPRIHFDPPATTHTTAVFDWETAATVNGVRVFPDGDYQLRAIRYEVPELRDVSSPLPVRVRQ